METSNVFRECERTATLTALTLAGASKYEVSFT